MEKSVIIFYNPEKKEIKKYLKKLILYFKKNGIRTFINKSKMQYKPKWAISLGGDGSILSTCKKIYGSDIPLLGINIGKLGFLTSADTNNMFQIIDLMLKNKLKKENRSLLQISFNNKNFFALNDCVIRTGKYARIIHIDIYIDNSYFTSYYSDGVIISTSTGSTAYNLAAGGPIVDSQLDNIIITPICPHSLAQRSVILKSSRIVTVKLSKESAKENIMISIDGQINLSIKQNSIINLKIAPKKITLLAAKEHNFFTVLKNKFYFDKR